LKFAGLTHFNGAAALSRVEECPWNIILSAWLYTKSRKLTIHQFRYGVVEVSICSNVCRIFASQLYDIFRTEIL
jgi:hypothetical protein